VRIIIDMARPMAWTGCVALCLVSSLAMAQFHGVPASVTSIPRGGDLFSARGVPASVTSLGPNGFSSAPILGIDLRNSFDPHHEFFIPRRHHRFFGARPVFFPVYYAPYYPLYSSDVYSTDVYGTQPVGTQPRVADYEEEPPAPTIFERRSRARSYPSAGEEATRYGEHRFGEPKAQPRESEEQQVGARKESATGSAAEAAPEEQQVTILVYRDGHRREVRNYAVVGKTLFDLSPGRMLRIPLAELDLAATRKANEEAGVEFVLP